MPIAARLRKQFYGKTWRDVIRPRILERARNKCEQCGKPNHARVFTYCHLHTCPGDDRYYNLRACCGWCHCNLDLQFHKQTRAARKDRSRPLLRAV